MRYAGVRCFWADHTDQARVTLRRYATGDCPGPFSHHDCHSGEVGRVAVVWDGQSWRTDDFPQPPSDDPRWPARCAWCEYEFGDGDAWQVFTDALYRRKDTGAEIALVDERTGSRGSGPPGMLFHMPWPFNARPVDGVTLGAVCPNGAIWCVDAPASTGGRWTRTGDPKADPPTVSATPSIVAGDYHGFLTDGRFTDDLGG